MMDRFMRRLKRGKDPSSDHGPLINPTRASALSVTVKSPHTPSTQSSKDNFTRSAAIDVQRSSTTISSSNIAPGEKSFEEGDWADITVTDIPSVAVDLPQKIPEGNGLHTIFESHIPAEIDIVAVHGLNPKNKKNHAIETWTRDNTLWLRDLLPDKLSKPARVMLFAYNSSPALGASSIRLDDHSRVLLQWLEVNRQGHPHRPLAFICHSLGGLVVKQALVEAKLDESYTSIFNSTCLLVFFGTPHQGGNHANIGAVAAKLFRMAPEIPHNDLVDALVESSNAATRRVEQARYLFERCLVVSFFEGKPYGKLGIIVDKKSCALNLPGSREKQVHLEADHSSMCKFDSGDSTCKLVLATIVSEVQRAFNMHTAGQETNRVQIPQLCQHFVVPYPRSKNFVGRTACLEALRSMVVVSDAQERRSLFGLGGIGKTQIVLEFAYRVRSQYPDVSVYWVHASNEERFRQSFKTIAMECKVPGHDTAGADVMVLVKRWLEQSRNGRWVMILDNADDLALFFPLRDSLSPASAPQCPILGQYIPECAHGALLVTTRNKQAGVRLGRGEPPIHIEAMNDTEASQLLGTSLHADTEDVRLLASRLENLPLALSQASAFIQEYSLTIPRYLERLSGSKDSFIDLLSEEFETETRDSEKPRAVAETWILTFRQIQHQHPLAAKIMSLMSFFDRQAIPIRFLRIYCEMFEAGYIVDLDKVLGILRAFSLVTLSKDESLDMHRLVHIVTRKWLHTQGLFQLFAGQATAVVSMAFPNDDSKLEYLSTCSTYLPHASAVLQYDGPGSEVELITGSKLQSSVFALIILQGRWKEMEDRSFQFISKLRRTLGEAHPQTLQHMHLLALSYAKQGNWAESHNLFETVVRIARVELGEEHPQTLASMSQRAVVLRDNGFCNMAESEGSKVLEIKKRVFGEDHAETLIASGDLALTLREQDKLEEARTLQMQVLEAQRKLLGGEHPDTLVSMGNLALTLKRLGKWDEADLMEIEVVEVRKRVLGPDHPYTLTAVQNLASTRWHLGGREGAFALLKECVRQRERVLGPEHPEVLLGRNLLAEWGSPMHDRGEPAGTKATADEDDALTRPTGTVSSDHKLKFRDIFNWVAGV